MPDDTEYETVADSRCPHCGTTALDADECPDCGYGMVGWELKLSGGIDV